MKHKQIKAFNDYPSPLKIIIAVHILLGIIFFAYSFTGGYIKFVVFLAISAAFVASGIGLYNRHEFILRALTILYNFAAVICVLLIIINIVTLSKFIYAIIFLVIVLVCFITSYYLTRPDILDCFYEQKDMHQMMTRKPY